MKKRIKYLEAENKKVKTENEKLNDKLAVREVRNDSYGRSLKPNRFYRYLTILNQTF